MRGVEFDGNVRVDDRLSFFGAAAYTDGKYVSFPDAPPPLEDTGEYVNPRRVLGKEGECFGVVDASYRSSFSSSATASKYLVVDRYALLNTRVGFRWADGWSVSLWARTLLDKNSFEC